MRAEGLIDARLLGDVRLLNLRRKPALVWRGKPKKQ